MTCSPLKMLFFLSFFLWIVYCDCENPKSRSTSGSKEKSSIKKADNGTESSSVPSGDNQVQPDSLLSELIKAITNDSVLSLHVLCSLTLNDTPVLNMIEESSSGSEHYIHTLSPSFLHALLERTVHPQFRRQVQHLKTTEKNHTDLRKTLKSALHVIRLLRKYPVLLTVLKNDRSILYQKESLNDGEIYSPSAISFDVLIQQSTVLNKLFTSGNVDQFTLMFWAECELSGTTELTEKLLNDIASLLDPPLEIPEVTPDIKPERNPAAQYFDPHSFIDPAPGIRSLLDCRDQLIAFYLDEVVATMYGDTVVIDDSTLQNELSAFSRYFNPVLRHFALMVDSLQKGTWESVRIIPRLTFMPQQSCGDFSLMILLEPVTGKQRTPVLFAALPKRSWLRGTPHPEGYYPLKATATRYLKRQPTDSNPSFLQTTYCFPAPECEKNIRTLLIVGQHRILHQGEKWNDTLRRRADLKYITRKEDTITIHTEHAFGSHLLHSAYIGNPLLTDVNGDSYYDIIVDVSGKRRLLFIQGHDQTFEMRILREHDATGGAGC